MKGLLSKFEKAMMAVTFAESGEHETARQLLKEEEPDRTNRPESRKRPLEKPLMRAT